jgi:hypothetical protein
MIVYIIYIIKSMWGCYVLCVVNRVVYLTLYESLWGKKDSPLLIYISRLTLCQSKDSCLGLQNNRQQHRLGVRQGSIYMIGQRNRFSIPQVCLDTSQDTYTVITVTTGDWYVVGSEKNRYARYVLLWQ